MKYDIKNNFSKIENVECPLIWGSIKKERDPFISIVIPTYKREDFLEECILSVLHQKDIDFNYEIIVVDNEETTEKNATQRLIEQLNVDNLLYYRNKKNVGGAGNWNRCILLARSKWVMMCHDDDLLKEDCLITMKQIIEEHRSDKKEIGYVRSTCESWYDSKLNIKRTHKQRFKIKKKRTALLRNRRLDVILAGGATWGGAPTGGTLINKEAFLSVGGYNDELTPCFDCYIPYHMLNKYSVYKTYHSLGIYRWSENDTYKKETIVGLIAAYNEFLEILSKRDIFVRFFNNEHYVDNTLYYLGKAEEANVVIREEDLQVIRKIRYSKIKLRILYILRKINSGFKMVIAR